MEPHVPLYFCNTRGCCGLFDNYLAFLAHVHRAGHAGYRVISFRPEDLLDDPGVQSA